MDAVLMAAGDYLFQGRLDAFTAGGGVIIRAGKAATGTAARAEAATGGPGLSLEPRGYVLGQLTRKPDGRTFILHLGVVKK